MLYSYSSGSIFKVSIKPKYYSIIFEPRCSKQFDFLIVTDKKKLFYFFQKQFFDIVPISATGFLSPESNATTAATAATPGISGGGASTSSPLNTGDVGISSTSGMQVGAMIFHRSLAIVCLE